MLLIKACYKTDQVRNNHDNVSADVNQGYSEISKISTIKKIVCKFSRINTFTTTELLYYYVSKNHGSSWL